MGIAYKFRMKPVWNFLAILLLAAVCLSARADEKTSMPDLAQVEETCLPTSTANLILWFGHHGYPKLIMPGATSDERELHTVHQIMTDTDARFDWGTRMDAVTVGINKYIHEAGYQCDVEYRGLAGKGTAFNSDWLKENDDPNKGFILLLAYCHVDPRTHIFTRAWNAGHAVTLVNAEPDTLLIHDPAHEDDETGRKIITPYVIPDGTWQDYGGSESVAGLMLLSGSLLEGPADGTVMLSGAVCITMQPPNQDKGPLQAGETTPSAGTLAGSHASPAGSAVPASPGKPATWWGWIFDFFFDK
jgi:hypothetical protein